MKGAFNDLCLTLGPGAREKAVIEAVDLLLERYGGLGAYGREDHPSHARFTQEFDELRAWGRLMPAIFLGIAVFLLQVVTTRLVLMQRDQIAVLKAFGYGNGAVAAHYLGLRAARGRGGGRDRHPPGPARGRRASSSQYARYFRFPQMRLELSPALLAWGIGTSARGRGPGRARGRAAGGGPSARGGHAPRGARPLPGGVPRAHRSSGRDLAARPDPAPEPGAPAGPARGLRPVHRPRGDRARGGPLSARRGGDGHGRALLHGGAGAGHRPLQPAGVDARARHDLLHVPGVLRVEPFRAVPIRLRFGPRVERTVLMGLAPGAELRRIVGRSQRPVRTAPLGSACSRTTWRGCWGCGRATW